MKKVKIDKEEALLTINDESIKEGFIISVTKYEDNYTFGIRIKIRTEDGKFVKNILIPFDLIIPFWLKKKE